MEKSYKSGMVLKNKEIYPGVHVMSIDLPSEGTAGQFYMVKVGTGSDPFLPRPLSIASTRNECVAFLYAVKGYGTELMSQMKVGDQVEILGPLGNGFNVVKKGKVALICGGMGIAPMLALSEEIGKSLRVDLLAGFRTGSFFIDYIQPFVDNVIIATEDGSVGEKGLVTDVFYPENYDMVYVCGPTPMMRAVVNKARGIVPVQISMENIMACGIGSCLGCSIKTSVGMRRVCKEGPVFDGEVVFYE